MSRKTYTVSQFLADEHRKDLEALDKVIGHIKRNKRLYTQLIVVLACISLTGGVSFADSVDTIIVKIDGIGYKFLKLARGLGYWIIAIKGISEAIQSGMQGDTHSIIRIFIKYLLLFGMLFLFPMALDAVKGAF